ncbi:MAG: sensor histidine kinase [Actinomycetota bacterium]|nr:sensor histidine kinase [Actinomycetota bacterium]
MSTATEPPPWAYRGRGAVVPSLVIALIQVFGTIAAAHDQPDRRPLDALAYVLLLAGPALLLFRRRYPVPVLIGVLAVTSMYVLIGYPYGPFVISAVVALGRAVLAGHRRAAWLCAGVTYCVEFGLRAFLHVGPRTSLGEAIGVAAWLLVLLFGVEQIRSGRERMAERMRAHEAEDRRRAGEERLRIARELHDVLAHNISLISVQAGVALHLMDEQPEQVRASLTAIKQASKDALGELRSVLGVLHQGEEEAPLSPAPSLAGLDDLVSNAKAAGVQVRTEVEGAPRPLPAGVDGTAFRIVQEALTNVVRHAGPAGAVVRVAYAEHDVTVQVDDDGRQVPSANGSGRGIDGMRERALAVGGELSAGPRPEGGFRVKARLPIDSNESAP